jgi:hypothetical protein
MGQVGKLGYVDAKLGAPTGGQQTTRIVYNTIPNVVGQQTLEYFKQFNGLTLGQTNLNTNKLDSSESMVIKTITLYNVNIGGGPYPTIDNDAARMTGGAVISVMVGNQEVVKRLPLQYNGSGQAFDRLHANAGTDLFKVISAEPGEAGMFDLPLEYRLLTDIVIPPQVSFSVKVELDAGIRLTSSSTCVLSGYGKIFSAGSSF